MKSLIVCAIAVSLAGGLIACDDDSAVKLECPADSGPFTLDNTRVTGTVSFNPPTKPLDRTETLTIRGTANHEDGLTIREVLVAGASAEKNEFNFKKWAATVSYDDLVTSGPANDQGEVEAVIVAIDACGNRYPFLTVTVAVDQSPNLSVDELTLSVAYPEGKDHLPADGAVSAVITVTAAGRADGATVQLSASSGTFQGTTAGDGVVVSSAFGEEAQRAQATALYKATEAGVHIITATVEGELATAMITAAGDPRLVPRSATLVPGASLDVTILTDGVLDTCQATISESVTVTHDGATLGAAPIAMSADDDGDYTLVVSASAEAPESTSVTITCEDAYGQSDSVTYELSVTDPPASIVVETLDIAVELPTGRDYLPANGSARAVLTITGTGKAAGAVIELSATSGSFSGTVGDTVILGGAETARAVALFGGDREGIVFITAEFEGTRATTTIDVAGAPRFAPAGATLLAGTSLDILVLSSGSIASCVAVPDPGFTVTTEDDDIIGAAPVTVPSDGVNPVVITVTAHGDADDNATTQLTCLDDYGQFTTATFSAREP